MSQTKKKWGDRPDAVWLKDIPSMNRIMPGIMPNRADNEAFINLDVDFAPLKAYVEKKNEGLDPENKYTFFHVIAAAIGKAFVLRPRMNRFICNRKVYQRNDITMGFTVKKKFSDKATESLAMFTYDPKETMDSFHEKIMKVIHLTKSDTEKDTSTGAMDILARLPQWLLNLLLDISAALSTTKTFVLGLNSRSTEDGFAIIRIEIQIKDGAQLSTLMNKLHQISGVLQVNRPVG